MRVFGSVAAWREFRASFSGSLGFVPTMGALHAGHGTLVARAISENDAVVVSIFVNPTQFNQAEDLAKYPRTLTIDEEFLSGLGADYLIVPTSEEMYPDGFKYRVSETEFSHELCGAHRPGHFDGVLTVVLKLFQIAGARRAYFGEKDFQQLRLVQGMARAFFLETQVVACPTVREADGLAMSSRNARLTSAEREIAPQFPRILASEATVQGAIQNLSDAGFKVDYVQDLEGRRLGAVWLGSVRLIDQMERNSSV